MLRHLPLDAAVLEPLRNEDAVYALKFLKRLLDDLGEWRRERGRGRKGIGGYAHVNI